MLISLGETVHPGLGETVHTALGETSYTFVDRQNQSGITHVLQ